MPKKIIKTEETKQDFVTKDEFNKLLSAINTLTEKINTPQSKTEVKNAMPEQFTHNDKVLSDIRKIVNEELGEDFGFELNYPLFRLFIPLEKSNSDKSYLAFYKKDTRTKALKNGEGIDKIKDFINQVKKNLNTKR